MKRIKEDGPPISHEKELQEEYIGNLSSEERKLYGVELALDTEEFIDPLIQVREEMSRMKW